MHNSLTTNNPQTLARAADAYREKCLASDPDHLKSLANGLKENVKDHDGRWLYELLQNAEDASAKACEFILTERTLIVSDNGSGIPSSAIKSLSLPHITTKDSSESIGQKGIGFCSVYELTNTPSIWSQDSGITFSKTRTKELFENENEIDVAEHPYLHTLLPFSLEEAPSLLATACSESASSGTKVILPLLEGIDTDYLSAQFTRLDPRFLLTFRNLERVTFRVGTDIKYSLTKDKTSDVTDSFAEEHSLYIQLEGEAPQTRTFKIWTKLLNTPEEILERTAETKKERERLSQPHTSLIYETTVGSETSVSDNNYLFVYYPTEQQLPLEAIIHGDFILNGSRKHLAKYSRGSYNHWLLQESVQQLIETVNSYSQSGQASFALQLFRLSGKSRDAQRVQLDALDELFGTFKTNLLSEILLPTVDGNRAPLKDLIFPEVNLPYREQTLQLIGLTFSSKSLAIEEICTNQARDSIGAYSDHWLTEADLLSKLKSPPSSVQSKSSHIEWASCAWQWLSNGLDEKSEFRRSLLFKEYRIIPTGGRLISAKNGASLPCLISENDNLSEFPEWLDISALSVEFSHWLQKSDESCRRLQHKLTIKKFSEQFVVEAFSKALSQPHYQEATNQIFQEFLEFALSRQWHLNPELENFNWKLNSIRRLRLPTLASSESTDLSWTLADQSYLGTDWNNPDLELVLPASVNTPRVSPSLLEQHANIVSFLQLCGVNLTPKVIPDESPDSELESSYWVSIRQKIRTRLPTQARNPKNRSSPKPKFHKLDSLNPSLLDAATTCALLRLLYHHWDAVYKNYSTATATYSHYGVTYPYNAPNIWLNALRLHVQAPSEPGTLLATTQLGQLWVYTHSTPTWAKKLFPRLRTEDIFQEQQEEAAFKNWITQTSLVKSQTQDLDDSDWETHIFPAIEEFVVNSQLRLKEKVHTATLFYRALLEYLTNSGWQLSPPRIALYEDELKLIPRGESIWITQSEKELKTWQAHLPVFLLRKDDLKDSLNERLGFRNLDDDIQRHLKQEQAASQVEHTPELQDQLTWIFAYRSHESKSAPRFTTWRNMKLFVRANLLVTKTVGKITLATEDPHFFDSNESSLYVTQETLHQPYIYAAALVKALKLPDSEAARIELLLSYNEQKRIERLTQDMSLEDFQTYCAEYTGSKIIISPASPLPKPPRRPLEKNQLPGDDSPSLPNMSPSFSQSDIPTNADDPDEAELHEPTTEVDLPSPLPLSLPRPDKGYPTPRPGYREKSASFPSGSRIPANVGEMETLSRTLVEKQLRDLGYEVTQMAQQNEGYDITATRGDQTLLIEVKGSKGAETTVYLTPAEERLALDPGPGRVWQLWHVSRLSKVGNSIPEIRVFDTLNPTACKAEKYLLDLSMLKQIQPL